MTKSEMEKDWLFGNSIVALTGALVWGIAWRPTGGEYTYPFINLTVSTDLDWFFIAIGAFMLFAAFFFGLASIFPIIRKPASGFSTACSPILKLFMFAGFVVALGDAVVGWPTDQWWTVPLMIGWLNRDSSYSSKSTDTETSEEKRRPGGLLLGSAVIFLFVLIGLLWPVRSQSKEPSD